MHFCCLMPCVVNFVFCTDTNEGSDKYYEETTKQNIYMLLRRRVGFAFFPKQGTLCFLLLEAHAKTLRSSVES